LENPHPEYVKESQKKVTDFICLEKEAGIKKFFMEEIDPLLEKYEPGHPKMKPDVLKQIAQIEKDRDKMMQEEMAKNGQIMMNEPGKPPVAMTMQQIADLLSKQVEMLSKQTEMLSKQHEQIQIYERRIAELETMNHRMQKVLLDKNGLKPDSNPDSKTEPLFKLDIE
jgi:DNA-binding transcriptional MerR regulator